MNRNVPARVSSINAFEIMLSSISTFSTSLIGIKRIRHRLLASKIRLFSLRIKIPLTFLDSRTQLRLSCSLSSFLCYEDSLSSYVVSDSILLDSSKSFEIYYFQFFQSQSSFLKGFLCWGTLISVI